MPQSSLLLLLTFIIIYKIRSYKLFRRRMLAYLKETKNPNTTDCMRFMNEQMVNIILNRYDNIDPNELMR